MEALPARARVYLVCVTLLGLFCLLPLPGLPRPGVLSSLPDPRFPWWPVVLLAALYAGCERLARSRLVAGPHPGGTFHPVLLAGAFLLPPTAAALVALPGALLLPVEHRPRLARRLWRTGQLVVAVWAASLVHLKTGGRDAVAHCDMPGALATAGAAVLAFCLVLTLLDGGVLAPAPGGLPRGRPAAAPAAWSRLFLGSLAPLTVHGLAGLMMALLWRSPYGPVAALLVLLPMGVSWWAFAQYHRERAAHQATIRALVQAVDIKDGYTRGHSERVGRASMLIARELGMDDDRVETLRFAGILHDVGKLGVPTRLLTKNGPLTPEERRIIELHPEYGHEMVRGISFLGEARAAVLHHHERIDGTGYPYGLAGGQIPESARVVAVADAFDAMTSTRSYSRARPVPVALEELQRCAGTHFDPRMVRALVRAIGRAGWHPAVTADEPRPTAVPGPAAPVTGRPGARR
ncbi:HD-GYP domain-containing protein [Streptomyces sp. Vc74B-19]|uniref:HD-GYP domain-containing protein n=1 Tax=unclassified Streptomyces TaxID=2593676 RepID=UPI001BFBFF90|nr:MULTISPECIES: HD-GYP domain-containing protein [unclassified Streptomyces]MBT3162090.1 HD-GYP domain-containing protein [Streptomyces sp. Vc74B-19]MCO4698098.1 HD-GYP domain-containing protein [Streptomyces sp. RO-S4]MDU0300007.1 HD-GYP domain-containing protein [Streptomyces sp. PAL114]